MLYYTKPISYGTKLVGSAYRYHDRGANDCPRSSYYNAYSQIYMYLIVYLRLITCIYLMKHELATPTHSKPTEFSFDYIDTVRQKVYDFTSPLALCLTLS